MTIPNSTSITSHPVVCCACSQQCGIVVDVADNAVVAIRGDKEHPGSQGFICPKGKHAHELHEHPDRIHQPLKRSGPRGSDSWIEIDWEQALYEIADKIAQITDLHGREALAYSFGTFRGGDWGIGERFMNLFGSPNACGQDKICYGPTALAETLTYGFGPTVFTAPVAGVTRCVVVWGMRPSASAPVLWKAIHAARKAGAKLIVIDPEFTREAARADLWLQLRPGTDCDIALGLLKVVIERDLFDHDFVRDHTAGFDALRKRVTELELEAVASDTGVPVEKIVDAAEMLATQTPTLINAGNGLCQSGSVSVQTGRAVACLVAITGNLDIEGGHALGGPPRDIVGNGVMMDANALDASQRAKRLGAERFAFLGEGYADVNAHVAKAWYGNQHVMSWFATAHEPSLWRAIVEEKPYAVKALIVQHHNPLGANANSASAAQALTSDKLELSVVQDLFMTPASRLADYVLPTAHWLEKPYFSLGLGFMAFVGDYVGANRAALEPAAGHRSDYDLWRDLGRRLGQEDAWPETAEQFYEGCLQPAGLSFERVCAERGPLMGADARNADKDVSDDSSSPAYGTPSGKVELSASLLADWGFDPLPHSTTPAIAAEREAYPYILTTGGRDIDGFHQNAQQTARFRRKNPDPIATLNPATAARAGIAEGEWFTIATPVGSVRQIAHLTHGLNEEVIRADRWWYPERANDTDDPYGFWATNINVCTVNDDANADQLMGTWLMRGVPCRIERVVD